MTFRLPGQGRVSAERSGSGGLAGEVVHFFLRLTFGVFVLVVVVAGVLGLRLAKGPIHMPGIAEIAARAFNQDAERVSVSASDMILTLGAADEPSGIQFVGVSVTDISGQTLFKVPRLAVRFRLRDLVRGELRPELITIIRPEARLLRTAGGRFIFGLGAAPEPQDDAAPDLPVDDAQVTAISRILDGMAGDGPLMPVLGGLQEIDILDADLLYENAATGKRWRTRQAAVHLYRTDDGLSANLDMGLIEGAGARDAIGSRITLSAERRRGENGTTRLELNYRSVRPARLADELEELEWLRLIDAPLNGKLALRLHRDGRIEDLTGSISAGPGRLLGLADVGKRFRTVSLDFAYERSLGRMHINSAALDSVALATRLSGFFDLERGPDDEVSGLAGQFEIGSMRIALPEIFAEPLAFDGGRIVTRVEFDPMRIRVAEAHLRNGPLVFDVTGEARAGPDGWHTDLRAGGRSLTVAQLVQHWPLVTATNARKWVEENITDGGVDELMALMRFGDGEPEINLDFTFSDLTTTYLGAMSPIRNATGWGNLTLDEFHLAMDHGEVEPVPGKPIRLDGSAVAMLNLRGETTPADIDIRASGATDSVLSLVNEEPLGLIGKLGLDPASVRGEARVAAKLAFPLIQVLKLEQIDADARAELSDLRLPFRLPGGQELDVSGNRGDVSLRATTTEMRLSGPVQANGAQLAIDWRELYGRGANHREMVFKGDATPDLLRAFGIGNWVFTQGRAPVKLALAQAGGPDFTFDLDADLGPAAMEVAEIGWSKPQGTDGRLKAKGSFGTETHINNFDLSTPDLKAAGSVALSPGGEAIEANIQRLIFRDLADVSVTARQSGAGTTATLTGPRLDLAILDGMPEQDGAKKTPLTVDFNLDELAITPKIVARPAAGTYRRAADGSIELQFAGRADGRVPFAGTYTEAGAEAGILELNAGDAGALLRAASLFPGAQGGELRLKARIGKDDKVTGVARIRDVRILNTGTFKAILDEGAKDVAKAAESGGYAFDTVRIPFEYRDGKLILVDAVAKGTLMAVKVAGTVDEQNDTVDLIGVISPAYALTGMLDNIPLLGTILSGGKGEGIFAMTFSVSGSLDDPKFSVNPLSLLTPGFLRKIFSGRAAPPDDRFIEQLSREID